MRNEGAETHCPRCGKINRSQARFCVSCGQLLKSDPALPLSQADQRQESETLAKDSSSPETSSPGVPPAVFPTPSTRSVEAVQEPSAATSGNKKLTTAIAGMLQAVADFMRDLWPDGAKGPEASPIAAKAGDYELGLKPVSGKASDIGCVRTVNEDSLIAFEFTKVQESRGVPIGFYVVADGMGGHRAGEIASRTVNKIVTERVLDAEVIPGLAFATRKLDETPASVLAAAIKEANRVLYDVAQKQGSDMGTTLTAALIIGDTATIANVGDSRTYLWRDGVLRQVTEDHSLVASLVKANMLRPEEVRSHPQRNQVFRSLGTKPDVKPDIFTETLQRGDRLVLCSDGLWEMVSDAEIGRIVGRAHSPQEACHALIQKAKDAGGDDNITVIVVKME